MARGIIPEVRWPALGTGAFTARIAMATLPVRRLLIDLKAPLPRHWNGGDAFRTAFFNALSMSFPVGEQFFIDSVRAGAAALPEGQRAGVDEEVKGFIGQEATHRHVHALFNGHLRDQGLVNHWGGRAAARIARMQGADVRLHLGVTAAAEHLTAILADHLLRHAQPLAGAEPRLATLWHWHASEETEHRSTAFDLYRALQGNERWRKRLFYAVTWHFLTDLMRQTANNLWHDGTWWRPSTWGSAWRLLLGREGVLRRTAGAWADYLRTDFHPAQQDDTLALGWLDRHQAHWRPVRPAVPAEADA